MSLAIEYPDPHCSTDLLLYCLSAPLPPLHTAPLSQWPNVSVLCCPIAHCPLPHCYTALLLYYLTVPVPHSVTVSLIHCTASLLHYPEVSQPHCRTFPLPHSLSTSLSHCSSFSVHFPCPIASLCHTASLSCYQSLLYLTARFLNAHCFSTLLFHCLIAALGQYSLPPSPLIPISHWSIASQFYCLTAYIRVPDCPVSSLLTTLLPHCLNAAASVALLPCSSLLLGLPAPLSACRLTAFLTNVSLLGCHIEQLLHSINISCFTAQLPQCPVVSFPNFFLVISQYKGELFAKWDERFAKGNTTFAKGNTTFCERKYNFCGSIRFLTKKWKSLCETRKHKKIMLLLFCGKIKK
jgi:hypothetical protein